MNSPVKVWRRQKAIRDLLGQKGSIISWTKIYTPPPPYKRNAPYVIVYVQLDSGQNICVQLVDWSDYSTLKRGIRVLVTVRKLQEHILEEVVTYSIACKEL